MGSSRPNGCAYVRDRGCLRCCMCGAENGTAVCDVCGHQFCKDCRRAGIRRIREAIKERLGRSELHCAAMMRRYASGGY
jgi:hypothetical protein